MTTYWIPRLQTAIAESSAQDPIDAQTGTNATSASELDSWRRWNASEFTATTIDAFAEIEGLKVNTSCFPETQAKQCRNYA